MPKLLRCSLILFQVRARKRFSIRSALTESVAVPVSGLLISAQGNTRREFRCGVPSHLVGPLKQLPFLFRSGCFPIPSAYFCFLLAPSSIVLILSCILSHHFCRHRSMSHTILFAFCFVLSHLVLFSSPLGLVTFASFASSRIVSYYSLSYRPYPAPSCRVCFSFIPSAPVKLVLGNCSEQGHKKPCQRTTAGLTSSRAAYGDTRRPTLPLAPSAELADGWPVTLQWRPAPEL